MVKALEGRDVWDYAEGSISKGLEGNDARIWRQNNAIATGLIKGALSETQLGHVIDIRNAKEV
jgi:hypothetical protein